MVSSVSTTSSSATSLLSQAVSAAKSKAASQTSNTSSSTSTTSSVASAALSSLAGNFNQFLTLLTTQLQHQDPSNPTSTDSFTSELAQFAGVQQQVETNSNLTSLLTATQDTQMTSGIGLIGKTTTATSSALPLQNGNGSMSFVASVAGPVAIAVTDSNGQVVKTDTVTAQVGTNSWSWNGVSDSGTQLSDGQYFVAVEGTDTTGSSTALSTTVSGTVTGLNRTSSGVNVQMGDTSIALSDLDGFSGA
ncbi:flagellar hook assembly protein FlgD [Gluconobacter thailandicus]|uniref:Basal-body rod modification protein FlgD n=1 Tax=Gluconobacter thailandicus TaxID=257438 RepID=A0AAP9JGX6_GLUTH|nr:flagellar hook capping FlgD N-terminal domain-containing protein [Gluconobacter thailandicus]KXV33573.1 flagellar biosynthesis protein FlgD [Gluconobacter thailandicus]QEH95131.1 flagellar biosynthesis protein FlgD [Gluconobacter thailandicus]